MITDELKNEVEQLKKDIISDDWELVKYSRNRLGQIGGNDIIDFLIQLLNSDDKAIRNSAALTLSDIKDNVALEPILTAIFKKENHNLNGTMVYALESLDCSRKLKEIFKILFYETYLSKLSAYNILCDQIFDFTKQDIVEIQQMWEECKKHPETCPCFDDPNAREMMQDGIDGFIGYLNP